MAYNKLPAHAKRVKDVYDAPASQGLQTESWGIAMNSEPSNGSRSEETSHSSSRLKAALQDVGLSVVRWTDIPGLWVMVRAKRLEAPARRGSRKELLANHDRAVAANLGVA